MEVPNFISAAATRGLRYYDEGYAGSGVTDQTVEEARAMAGGNASDDKIIRANAWAARHAVDLETPRNHDQTHPEYPGPGAVAHMLWGISPTTPERARDWFSRTARRIKQKRLRSQAEAIADAIKRLSNQR